MKKIVKINGKTYVVDLDTKQMEEVEEEEEVAEATPETPEATPEETPAEGTPEGEPEAGANEAEVEEKVDEAAEKIMKSLGIEEIRNEMKSLKKKLEAKKSDSKYSALVNFEKLMSKSTSEMTSNEKIVGFFQGIVQNNHAVMKALSEGTAADGGYLFPDEFRAEIIRDMADTPHMRNEVTVIPMKRDVMNIPTLESGPQVTWTEENATKSTTTAHFGQKTLTVKKMAAILYASDELIEDSTEIDIVRFIIGLFSEAIGNEEDRVITRGNGTTEPTGLATATIGSTAVLGNLSFDDMINLEFLLPAKYHANAKYYAHRNNIRELRKLKDNTGRYLWMDSVAPGQPATFHGYPVVENNHLSESEIYFGDLKKAYWLGDRKAMTVKVSNDTETAFTKDQTAIRVVSRIAGNVVLPFAVKKLTNIP
jgi:HK97 family phage major capsid protein